MQVCKSWGIAYLSLDDADPEALFATAQAMDPKPRVILSTITRVSNENVQRQLRRFPIRTISLDEAQVVA